MSQPRKKTNWGPINLFFHFVETPSTKNRPAHGKVVVRLGVGSTLSPTYETGIKASKQAWDNRLLTNSPLSTALRKQLLDIITKVRRGWAEVVEMDSQARKCIVTDELILQKTGLPQPAQEGQPA